MSGVRGPDDVLHFLDAGDEGAGESANCPACGGRLEFRISHELGTVQQRCQDCADRGKWRLMRPRPAPKSEFLEEYLPDMVETKIGGVLFRKTTAQRHDTPAIAAALYALVSCLPDAAVSARTLTNAVEQPIEVTCHILGRFVDEGAMRREKRANEWHYWRVR